MAETAEIMVVDDDESVVTAFRQFLTDEGHRFRIASSGDDAIRAVQASPPDVVIMDVRMPGTDGLAALERIRQLSPQTYVVIMTAYGSSQTSIEAMRLGAFDYLNKPLDLDDLRAVIGRALGAQKVSRNVSVEPAEGTIPSDVVSLIGQSERMLEVYKLIGLLATNDVTPLIVGERGTGKQLVAQTIHANSPRREKPFVAFACGALPHDLVAAELFGHVGAGRPGSTEPSLPGRVDAADGGTLFLGDVDALPATVQADLVRLMTGGGYRRFGELAQRAADVRIIAGAETDLSDKVRQGRFAAELYEALSVITIALPPLREHPADIPELVSHFIRRFNLELGRTVKGIDDRAARAMASYRWPDNIAQLQTVIKRACILSRGDVLTMNEIGPSLQAKAVLGREDADTALQAAARAALHQALVETDTRSGASLFRDIVEGVEETLVREALAVTGGNQVKASELLGLNRATLRKKM